MRGLTFAARELWLDWRRQGVGGSDAAAICGLDPFRTPVVVFLQKRGQIPEREETEQMEWGRRLESPIIEGFEDRTGFYVRDRQQGVEHPQHPWMRATLDGVVYEDPGLESPLGLYEGKTTSQLRFGFDWSDGPPDWVLVQVQHEFAVTGLERAWITCLVGGQRLRWWEVPRDDAVIEQLIEVEARFWQDTQNGIPPAEVDGSEPTRRAIREAYQGERGTSVELPPEALDLLRMRAVYKERIRECERDCTEVENRLALMLGDAEGGTVDGQEVVRWSRVETKRLNVPKLRAEYPGIWERFAETDTHRRWFVPKEDSP